MSIVELSVERFRNLRSAHLSLGRLNLFYGPNGSGKSSLLEALYYLVLGRSLRSHLLRRIVQHGETNFSLFGKLQVGGGGALWRIGLYRSIDAGKELKINGRVEGSHIEVVRAMPLQVFSHDSYRLLQEGPKSRREFIDWGLFHVKHDFLEQWHQVERLLRQRNSAIRTQARRDYIRMWDQQLAQHGEELGLLRARYVEELKAFLTPLQDSLGFNHKIELGYRAGWPEGEGLWEALDRSLRQDLQLGYTGVGPHRADLQIMVDGKLAKDTLSRGQQKMLVYLLQMAQVRLLARHSEQEPQRLNSQCVCLVDDLLAELDSVNSRNLARSLLEQPQAQLFFTGLDWEGLERLLGQSHHGGAAGARAVFSLAHGVVTCEAS